jgi:hypothetical protein
MFEAQQPRTRCSGRGLFFLAVDDLAQSYRSAAMRVLSPLLTSWTQTSDASCECVAPPNVVINGASLSRRCLRRQKRFT